MTLYDLKIYINETGEVVLEQSSNNSESGLETVSLTKEMLPTVITELGKCEKALNNGEEK